MYYVQKDFQISKTTTKNILCFSTHSESFKLLDDSFSYSKKEP